MIRITLDEDPTPICAACGAQAFPRPMGLHHPDGRREYLCHPCGDMLADAIYSAARLCPDEYDPCDAFDAIAEYIDPHMPDRFIR